MKIFTQSCRSYTIIDIGGSYKKLTVILGGQYFEVKMSDEYAINPFDIVDVKLGPSSEKVKSLVSIIEQMVTDRDKLSKYERVLIEKAINDTYVRLNSQAQVPILSDFELTCRTSLEPELNKVAKLLYSWVGTSAYGKMLDRHGSLKTDALVTAFDLKVLPSTPTCRR